MISSESGGAYSILNIGALLLSKRLADFPGLEFRAPRLIRYKGTSKLGITAMDRPGTKGYAVGFRGLIAAIKELLPFEEVIEEGIRKQIPLVPEIVLRELVANALIHQDFAEQGIPVLIEIFDDRVEVSNPGTPIVPVERLIDQIRSRNERLADLMRKVGICEKRGSGIDRVVDAAELMQLSAPKFFASEKRTVAIVHGRKAFEEMEVDDRVRACFQHCALKFENGARMTNQSLRKRFNLPDSKAQAITRLIATTVEAKLIKADEQLIAIPKFACYVPSWA